MNMGRSTKLLWACVIVCALIALAAVNGVLQAVMLFNGTRAEVNLAIWGSVFVLAMVGLVACAVRLWRHYPFMS